jgi:hypothetical protein
VAASAAEDEAPVRRKGLKASLQHFRRQSKRLEWRLQPLRTKPLSVEKA